jgi:hypothetical protein
MLAFACKILAGRSEFTHRVLNKTTRSMPFKSVAPHYCWVRLGRGGAFLQRNQAAEQQRSTSFRGFAYWR